MTDLPFRSARQLAALIRQKKLGCLELLETYIARVDRYNPRLNAIVVSDLDGARRRARAMRGALCARLSGKAACGSIAASGVVTVAGVRRPRPRSGVRRYCPPGTVPVRNGN